MRRSKESSGVRTCTAPRVSSQPRATASSEAWAASASAVAGHQRPDVLEVPPLAEQEDDAAGSRRARGAATTWSAAHGSSPAPKRGTSASWRSAAGLARPRRCAPGSAVRSPVAERSPSLAWKKATRPANSWRQALLARTAPLAGSCSVTTCWRWPATGGPSTHSA